MRDVDVAIVGAGCAGLAAAKVLQSLGRTCAVIEAGSRIGGRAWTHDRDFGVPFDVGCAWLHAADRNPFLADAQAAGWDLHHHDMALDHLYHGGVRAGPSELLALARAEADLALRLAAHDAPEDRLGALIADRGAEAVLATFAGPMDYGADADEISLRDFRQAAELDPNFLTRQGFGALVRHWGAAVPVVQDAPVRRIRWGSPGVEVESDRGTLRAAAVIVTVSTGVLAFGEIGFLPALPAAHEAAVHDLPMGLLTKIPLAVRGERFGLQPFDDLLVERRSRHDLFFLCFPFDADLMVGFVGGDFAWEIEAAGAAAAVDFATSRLVDLFGSRARAAVGHGAMTHWAGERFVRGAYAVARPGCAGARAALAAPVADRIWFAGEALAPLGLQQTAGGARLSGERVARAVAATIGA